MPNLNEALHHELNFKKFHFVRSTKTSARLLMSAWQCDAIINVMIVNYLNASTMDVKTTIKKKRSFLFHFTKNKIIFEFALLRLNNSRRPTEYAQAIAHVRDAHLTTCGDYKKIDDDAIFGFGSDAEVNKKQEKKNRKLNAIFGSGEQFAVTRVCIKFLAEVFDFGHCFYHRLWFDFSLFVQIFVSFGESGRSFEIEICRNFFLFCSVSSNAPVFRFVNCIGLENYTKFYQIETILFFQFCHFIHFTRSNPHTRQSSLQSTSKRFSRQQTKWKGSSNFICGRKTKRPKIPNSYKLQIFSIMPISCICFVVLFLLIIYTLGFLLSLPASPEMEFLSLRSVFSFVCCSPSEDEVVSLLPLLSVVQIEFSAISIVIKNETFLFSHVIVDIIANYEWILRRSFLIFFFSRLLRFGRAMNRTHTCREFHILFSFF